MALELSYPHLGSKKLLGCRICLGRSDIQKPPFAPISIKALADPDRNHLPFERDSTVLRDRLNQGASKQVNPSVYPAWITIAAFFVEADYDPFIVHVNSAIPPGIVRRD